MFKRIVAAVIALTVLLCAVTACGEVKKEYPIRTTLKYVDDSSEFLYYLLPDDEGYASYAAITQWLLIEGSIAVPNKLTYEDGTEFPIKTVGLGYGVSSAPSELQIVTFGEGVTTIGNNAFTTCTELVKILFPSTIETIGDNAFSCTAIVDLEIPASCKTIGESAFAACSKLSKLTISDGVKKIGSRAFAYCTAIEKLTIPASVEEIEDGAFSFCIGLKQIDIPEKFASRIGDIFSGYKGELGKDCEVNYY